MTDHSKLTLTQCRKLEAALVAKRDELRKQQGLPPAADHVTKLYQQLWGG